MPRPRFDKLSSAKQQRILESAAREFAAHGYDGASLNQILAQANISKGAAYYYFDDKADLFMTAVSHYSSIMMADLELPIDALTVDNFWPTLAEQYRHQFLQALDRPWLFGLFKAAGSLANPVMQDQRLASFSLEMQSMLRSLLTKGQSLALIRSDLDDELLYKLVVSVDEAHDRWLLPRWSQMDQSDVEAAVERIIDLLQRLLATQTN
ncbi:MAG: TetR/AcrR family transcriptional regulator [Candidatus Promineifilaceae bacterium]|nr:TetR/AcrR family transcriptional regulator [Candidatus Promineifilaceae bacterium]